MKLLLDCSVTRFYEVEKSYDFIGGQLLTPLTRFTYFGGEYAIDNGAYSAFSEKQFQSLLYRQREHIKKCLFVRVNTPRRYKHFEDLGVQTCDGSGASRYDWMLERISERDFDDHPLFETTEVE